MSCPTCGGIVPVWENDPRAPRYRGPRTRKYCSPSCQKNRHRWRIEKWRGLVCAHCDEAIDIMPQPGPPPKYCSRACKDAAENPRKRLARKGVTEQRYEGLLRDQDGRCAVCRRIFQATPHIDHDHSCCPGQTSCGNCVRGLLCEGCNRAIGFFGDDVVVMASAIEYLSR